MTITITLILVAITSIISFIVFQNQELGKKLLFYPIAINEQNQFYRWITSGFIHADSTHLIFNMIALYSFGTHVESLFVELFGITGKLYYLLFYISAIPIASLFDYFKNKENGRYAALGASGGVAAIIFSAILFNPFGTIYLYFLPIPSILFGVLYLAYTFYMSKKGTDNVGHNAHLFGSIYSIIFTIAIYPKIIPHFINSITNFLH